MKLLLVVLLVQVAAIGQHLLNIANLDRTSRSQQTAVNLYAGRVSVHERPDPQVFNVVDQGATQGPVERLILLNWDYRQVYQVGSSDDIALQAYEVR